MEVDLTKFDLKPGAVHPYLKIDPKESKYIVYEGAIGLRYRYFEISKNSKTGTSFGLFYERYFAQCERRYNYSEDTSAIMLQVDQDGTIEQLSGADAYLKYWNSFSQQDKSTTGFNIIPFFEALKEWFDLALSLYLKKNSHDFMDNETKIICTQKWVNHKLEEIEDFFKLTNPPYKYSVLSMTHAKELYKFYKWVKLEKVEKSEIKIPLPIEMAKEIDRINNILQNFGNAALLVRNALVENAKSTANFHETQNFKLQGKVILDESLEDADSLVNSIDIKPTFAQDQVGKIFEILRDHFSKNQQEHLKQILETGDDSPKRLFFKGPGNRLADVFKQLYDTNLISGCQKRELESWISRNFQFRFRGKVKRFTTRYLNDIISTKKDLCKNPLLNVTKDRATDRYLIRKG